MATATRSARLPALAKLNLSLKVLGKRPDGYHELRTVFQTISLADTIEAEYTPSRRRTGIELASEVEIPDNLIVRAATLVMEATGATGVVRFRLMKRIPMGGGLGGGSTDAAAVLLGLPVLLGRRVPLDNLHELAGKLGSDVPFFLYGGTALGLGRGTEIYPLPDFPARPALVVTPAVHVATPEAYGALRRGELTGDVESFKLNRFRSFLWSFAEARQISAEWFENDFEAVVFERYPELASTAGRLRKRGADPAVLTGSGASLFGLFRTAAARNRARSLFKREEERVYSAVLVSRRRYHALWRRALGKYIDDRNETLWPPQSPHTGR
jgi:4-diphosphocytidyl-2-C-methyl-D-erythritol kinase